jgi:hypothetical protein
MNWQHVKTKLPRKNRELLVSYQGIQYFGMLKEDGFYIRDNTCKSYEKCMFQDCVELWLYVPKMRI